MKQSVLKNKRRGWRALGQQRSEESEDTAGHRRLRGSLLLITSTLTTFIQTKTDNKPNEHLKKKL